MWFGTEKNLWFMEGLIVSMIVYTAVGGAIDYDMRPTLGWIASTFVMLGLLFIFMMLLYRHRSDEHMLSHGALHVEEYETVDHSDGPDATYLLLDLDDKFPHLDFIREIDASKNFKIADGTYLYVRHVVADELMALAKDIHNISRPTQLYDFLSMYEGGGE